MKEKDYTIIHHISGESNLMMENIAAFNEICAGALNTEKINFVILIDMMQVVDKTRLLKEELQYLTKEEMGYPTVYLVQKEDTHKNLSLAEPAKERKVYFKNDDLATSKNLQKIVKEIKETFPAKHYAYVYKGHGGPDGTDVHPNKFIAAAIKLLDDEVTKKKGETYYRIEAKQVANRIKKDKLEPWGWRDAAADVFSLNDDEKPTTALVLFSKPLSDEDEREGLTYPKLGEVLKNVFGEKGLAYILLDCCWGMSLENIRIFEQNTNYLVASADECPALGIGYKQFGEFLSRDLEFNHGELAKMLVANYFTINYADYYSPIEAFRKMGVSLSCADTTKIERVIDLLAQVFELLSKKKRYANLIKCAKYCRDYTYDKPTMYCAFNVDLVWFLECLIYEKEKVKQPDSELSLLSLETIKEIKLFLIAGFIGTNYPDVVYGKKALGGRGLTFPFPKWSSHYDKSILPGKSYEIFEKIQWKYLLLDYYEHLTTLDPDVLDALRKEVGNLYRDKETKESFLKGATSDNLFSGDLHISSESIQKISEIKERLSENAIDWDNAYKVVINSLRSNGDENLFGKYIELTEKENISNTKWRRHF